MSDPKFSIKQTPSGEWHWVFKAANGEIVAQSETYETRDGAEKGIESLKAGAPSASVVYEDFVPELEDAEPVTQPTEAFEV